MKFASSPAPVRILCLHTSAGGGHTSAMTAIMRALKERYGSGVQLEMVDILKDYAPPPLHWAPEHYRQIMRWPALYKPLFYSWANGRRRAEAVMGLISRYSQRQVGRMLREHPADVIVSTYHFASSPVLMRRRRPPIVTVITDLVTLPPVWFDRRAELTIAPTRQAYEQCLAAGMDPARVREIGFPVAPEFATGLGGQRPDSRQAARRELDWPADRLVALLMAGSDGVGPVEPLARAIAASGLPLQLVVVTGRNRRLAARLRRQPWAANLKIYEFVENMPTFMRAADVLLTKAGAASIAEALTAGLPMLIYRQLPGQEEGHADFVTQAGAGYWTPRPEQAVRQLRTFIDQPDSLRAAAQAGRQLARPHAATAIAELVMAQVSQNKSRK